MRCSLVCVSLLSMAWSSSALAAPRPVEPLAAMASPPPPPPYPYRRPPYPTPYPPSDRFATPPPGDPPPDDGASRAAMTPVPVDGASAPAAYTPRRRRGHFPTGWLLPVGVNLGGVLQSGQDGAGFLVGGEVSVVKFPIGQGFWAGAYADALYDRRASQARFSAGPEVGWAVFGVDAGVYGALGDQHSGWGLAVRGMLSAGFLIPYARVGFPLENARRDPRFVEIGALLKLPLVLVPD